MSEAYDDGYMTFQRWVACNEEIGFFNPYEDGTIEYINWETGWNDASIDADNINPDLKGKEL